MSLLVSRLVGAVLMLAGIAVALWVVFGVPQEWTGRDEVAGAPRWR